MSNLFETAMAVQLGMMLAQNNVGPAKHYPYDGISLDPDVDPNLPPREYMDKIVECLVNQKPAPDIPEKKHWWQK